jgi:hypothetical protein
MRERTRDVARASFAGAALAALVVLGIWLGSGRFRDFDTALVPYAGAAVLAAFGIGYRYTVWLLRPPTRIYWLRSTRIFFQPAKLPSNVARLARLLWDNIITQKFIEHRSPLRWVAHLGIFWGCVLAAAVTFPLSFGWIRFETARGDPSRYEAFVFGHSVLGFALDGPLAPLAFNVLDVSAVLVIAGVACALWRRTRDRGALAVQQFSNDILPLFILFAISVTGLLLSVSAHFLRGFHYGFLSQVHAVTVIFGLLYLPFGKFFHIFQRPAQLGVAIYREHGERGPRATCARCGSAYASATQVQDLKLVQRELGIGYDGEAGHWQDVCPPCRRKSVALAQDALWRAAREERR